MEWGCIKVQIGLTIDSDDPRFERFKRSFDNRWFIDGIGYQVTASSPTVVTAIVTKRQVKELGQLEYVSSIGTATGKSYAEARTGLRSIYACRPV